MGLQWLTVALNKNFKKSNSRIYFWRVFFEVLQIYPKTKNSSYDISIDWYALNAHRVPISFLINKYKKKKKAEEMPLKQLVSEHSFMFFSFAEATLAAIFSLQICSSPWTSLQVSHENSYARWRLNERNCTPLRCFRGLVHLSYCWDTSEPQYNT